LRTFLRYLFKTYQHLLFKFIVEKTHKPLLIIDIDNTIANTWPTLNQKWISEKFRVINLQPIQSVINHLKEKFPEISYEWIFLTSRSYNLRKVTIKWLKNQNLPANNSNVVLVQNPNEKLFLINKFANKRIVYFDDLTYNHENGEIKYYSNVIEGCMLLTNVQYYGYKQIINIIDNHDQSNK
jgi:hypothetical protein